MVPGFRTKEIKPAKSVGQRLKATRQRKGLSLVDAERLTKIKLKYLKALEEDNHDQLPTEVYSLGFLRCYGEVLELNTAKLQLQYRSERRAFKSAKGQAPQMLAPAKRLAGPRFLITPRTIVATLSVLVVLGLILYVVAGIQGFLAPPALTVTDPKTDVTLTNQATTVAGMTDPTASLTINGETVSVAPDGSFRREISLIPGLNILEFVSVSRVGKEAKQVRKILADYQLPPTPVAEVTPLSPTPGVTPLPSPSIRPVLSPVSSSIPSSNPKTSPKP